MNKTNTTHFSLRYTREWTAGHVYIKYTVCLFLSIFFLIFPFWENLDNYEKNTFINKNRVQKLTDKKLLYSIPEEYYYNCCLFAIKGTEWLIWIWGFGL